MVRNARHEASRVERQRRRWGSDASWLRGARATARGERRRQSDSRACAAQTRVIVTHLSRSGRGGTRGRVLSPRPLPPLGSLSGLTSVDVAWPHLPSPDGLKGSSKHPPRRPSSRPSVAPLPTLWAPLAPRDALSRASRLTRLSVKVVRGQSRRHHQRWHRRERVLAPCSSSRRPPRPAVTVADRRACPAILADCFIRVYSMTGSSSSGSARERSSSSTRCVAVPRLSLPSFHAVVYHLAHSTFLRRTSPTARMSSARTASLTPSELTTPRTFVRSSRSGTRTLRRRTASRPCSHTWQRSLPMWVTRGSCRRLTCVPAVWTESGRPSR